MYKLSVVEQAYVVVVRPAAPQHPVKAAKRVAESLELQRVSPGDLDVVF